MDMSKEYDYLIVGSGLYGAVFAHEMTKNGRSCLVIDRRDHIGGNVYTKEVCDINVHVYGAHIFHTSNKAVWDYMNSFAEFNRYTNSPVARYKDELYNLPFNMNTFHALWGVITPEEAKQEIERQKKEAALPDGREPENMAEAAIQLVGADIFEKLVKGYTAKQWGRPAKELPPFIIKRLPVRFTYDNNYFNDSYQGIPVGGYTKIIEKMLAGSDVRLSCDFFEDQRSLSGMAAKTVFTGMIDEYFGYRFGELEYRSLRFENKTLDIPNFQGNAVVNYTEYEIPYTRIIEHKHFEFGTQDKTVITYEYPSEWKKGDEPYYPLNDDKNNKLFARYKELAGREENVIFGGRLGEYRYYDMHQVVARALEDAALELKG